MVRIIVAVVFYFLSFMGIAQNTDNKSEKLQKINVVVKNINSDKGKVYFALYNSEEDFNKKKAIALSSAKIENGISEVSFLNLQPSYYAIICFHDANENGKMDFETNGMPKEDYGVSNNVLSFGPPQFNDAKFELKDKDLTFEIKF